jgi:hypothetical protein
MGSGTGRRYLNPGQSPGLYRQVKTAGLRKFPLQSPMKNGRGNEIEINNQTNPELVRPNVKANDLMIYSDSARNQPAGEY